MPFNDCRSKSKGPLGHSFTPFGPAAPRHCGDVSSTPSASTSGPGTAEVRDECRCCCTVSRVHAPIDIQVIYEQLDAISREAKAIADGLPGELGAWRETA